jgi:hypothetical protein
MDRKISIERPRSLFKKTNHAILKRLIEKVKVKQNKFV